ncbi:hypothetical protein TEA_005747 [Camellia sinensis var. sinensis]|uniref:RRM domain-containing protein n=1 Tax=Camellia sinensis var. sinensis TaxID=542762 RepID=A0A4S4EN68_CAMSN|nr:hypothetical protein TEA_005747 [Camellia sinensis var. sinensis]
MLRMYLEALERHKRRKTEIFIGGLGKDAKEEDVRKVFQQAGEIVEVSLVMNDKTGKNKGFAFVQYASAADAMKALAKFSKVEAPKKDKAPPPSSKPAKSGGGKQKKKKWSKGKQKEKVNNMVLFDKATYDKLLSEAPKYKLITPSILSDRLRVNGSLARKAIRELMARGLIRMFVKLVWTENGKHCDPPAWLPSFDPLLHSGDMIPCCINLPIVVVNRLPVFYVS